MWYLQPFKFDVGRFFQEDKANCSQTMTDFNN